MAVATGAVVWSAVPASAHAAGAPRPSDYRSDVIGIVPSLPGVKVTVLELGRRIRLDNRSGTDVTVVGYHGEPYLRVGPGGLFENRRAPTLYENRTVNGAPVAVPAGADAAAAPDWQRVSTGHAVTWADHRPRYTGPTPTAVRAHPGRTTVVVPQWVLPLRVAGTEHVVLGTVTWVPRTSILPWLLVAVALALAVLAAAWSPWWGELLSGATALLIAVDVVHAVGIAGATSKGAGAGATLVRLAAGSYLSAIAWAVGVMAVVALQRRAESGLVAACFCGTVIAVMSGATDVAALTRSQLPVALPVAFGRLAVAVALGLGGGLAIAAASRLRALAAQDGRGQDAPARAG